MRFSLVIFIQISEEMLFIWNFSSLIIFPNKQKLWTNGSCGKRREDGVRWVFVGVAAFSGGGPCVRCQQLTKIYKSKAWEFKLAAQKYLTAGNGVFPRWRCSQWGRSMCVETQSGHNGILELVCWWAVIMLATKYVVGTLRGNGCNCWKWCVPPSGGALSGGGPCVHETQSDHNWK